MTAAWPSCLTYRFQNKLRLVDWLREMFSRSICVFANVFGKKQSCGMKRPSASASKTQDSFIIPTLPCQHGGPSCLCAHLCWLVGPVVHEPVVSETRPSGRVQIRNPDVSG